jgi:N-acetylneuraminic acid mutarotase
MPTARLGLGLAAAANGKLYAIGGSTAHTGTIGYSTANQAYTPGTDRWTDRAPMPQGRSEPNGAGVINGVIYVPGGFNGPRRNTLFAYTVASNTWATKAPMPIASSSGASGAIGGKLYVLHGRDAATAFLRRLDRFRPSGR